MSVGFATALLSEITTGGLGDIFTQRRAYALVVAGPAGFFLLQNALQGGRLVAPLPGMTPANSLTALDWGITVIGERVQQDGWIFVTFGEGPRHLLRDLTVRPRIPAMCVWVCFIGG